MVRSTASFQGHASATLQRFARSKPGATRVSSGEGHLFQMQNSDLRVARRFKNFSRRNRDLQP